MAGALLAAIVFVPITASVAVVLVWRISRRADTRVIGAAAAGITVLCALVLLSLGTRDSSRTLEWLPHAGAMALKPSPSGLYIVVVAALAATLALSGDLGSRRPVRPLSIAIGLAAMAAANVALLASHFLARYVALEMVVLAVAAVPVVEVSGPAGMQSAWRDYLVLRVGSAALLAGIILLTIASGTLSIGPALEHAVDTIRAGGVAGASSGLYWAAAALAMAAWVKQGGWPFHVWGQSGERLSLVSHAWLYATLVPALGVYLLYRITPALSLAAPARQAAVWAGSGAALIAALLALTRPSARSAFPDIGAVQAGLTLLVASAGIGPAVWLSILALTPVRLLLLQSADAARQAARAPGRFLATALFGLGGAAFVAYGLLAVRWAAGAGLNPVALPIALAAVGSAVVWVVASAVRLAGPRSEERVGPPVPVSRWIAVSLLAAIVLAGALLFGPLARLLSDAGHMGPVETPSLITMFLDAPSSLALLGGAALGVVAWALSGLLARTGRSRPLARPLALQRTLNLGARAAGQIEHRLLDAAVDWVAGAAVALARWLQHWHTGKLRRNLVWVPLALGLALAGLMAVAR